MAELELTCPKCGKRYTHGGAFLAKHVAKCQGKVQTRGRIDRLTHRRPAAASSAASAERVKEEVPEQKHSKRAPVPSNGHVRVRPADFLAALRAERDKIDAAIRAVEALA